MKNKLSIILRNMLIIFIMCCFGTAAYAVSNSQKKQYLENHFETLKSIKQFSNDVSCDINKDFLNNIIHQNDIEICFCENIIKYTDDIDVRNTAKKLIKESMECTTELNDYLENINKEENLEKAKKFYDEYHKVYDEMISKLECDRNDDESIELIFLKSSKNQYECTMKIVEIISDYTENKEITSMAHNISEKCSNELKLIAKITDKL